MISLCLRRKRLQPPAAAEPIVREPNFSSVVRISHVKVTPKCTLPAAQCGWTEAVLILLSWSASNCREVTSQ